MDIAKLTFSIQQHEGLRLKPYVDTTGNITLSYGVNITAGITQDEADYLFNSRFQSALREAQTESWWQYVADNDARSRAMVEMCYNMGAGGVAGFHDALAAMQRGDWNACAAGFLNSLWAKQVGQRAQTLAAMILTGEDSAS